MRISAKLLLAAVAVALCGAVAAGPAAAKEKLPPIDMSEAEHCDFIAEPQNTLCMLPFPNDYYTVRDPGSATGRRVHFTAEGMPRNAFGKPIDPAPYGAERFTR